MSARKPLQLSEVSELWRECIQWGIDSKRGKGTGYLVCVKCPMCSRLHWMSESHIRMGRYKSPRCRICAARKELQPHEVSDSWRALILWDKARERTSQGYWAVWVRCSSCKKERLVTEVSLRGGVLSSGLCADCSKRQSGPDCKGAWRGGRKQCKKTGYVSLHINGLEGKEYDLAKKMMGESVYVLEHRLFMALWLDRPLTQEEVVHHKDGHRSNNDMDNLELLTKETHYSAHGNPFYQRWQEVLSLLREVKDCVSLPVLRYEIDVMVEPFVR